MARTKDVNVTPEQEEKMTQEVMASFQSSAYGKSDERDYSPLFGELDDAASVNSEAATNAQSSNMERQRTSLNCHRIRRSASVANSARRPWRSISILSSKFQGLTTASQSSSVPRYETALTVSSASLEEGA